MAAPPVCALRNRGLRKWKGSSNRRGRALASRQIHHYNYVMRFDWDEHKNQRNRAKHGVSFETACLVFDDPQHLSIQDRQVAGEERW